MPDRNPSPHSADECNEKQIQRAVLALLLFEYPCPLTKSFLGDEIGYPDAVDAAITALIDAGLAWSEGEAILPTAAARHFEWLELP
jgi:hypothetical protein